MQRLPRWWILTMLCVCQARVFCTAAAHQLPDLSPCTSSPVTKSSGTLSATSHTLAASKLDRFNEHHPFA